MLNGNAKRKWIWIQIYKCIWIMWGKRTLPAIKNNAHNNNMFMQLRNNLKNLFCQITI